MIALRFRNSNEGRHALARNGMAIWRLKGRDSSELPAAPPGLALSVTGDFVLMVKTLSRKPIGS
jgi:hypothetical protein